MTECACGNALHYTHPDLMAQVQKLVDAYGDYTEIEVAGAGRFKVQRHYIALHGVRARDLPALADEGIVERIS